ncbi:MAG: hypothetical protein LBT16_08890 [Treponema sp.]|jgi:hypothetical protein|nr:hypothetical protein [Treponema sp.]
MEVSFTLWSLHDVLEKVPFDTFATEQAVHLDFSKMAVPFYVKDGFRVSFLYADDSYPRDAACLIYSPKNVVTIVIVLKRKFEDALEAWFSQPDDNGLAMCCRRRELYCHETCHLIAIVRAYPSDRSSRAREDFIRKIKEKFAKSINDAENSMSIPLISTERPEDSPSVFNQDHFRYENDNLNYFRLYDQLMLDDDTMRKALKKICDSGKRTIYLEDISKETFVPVSFFQLFPEKVNALRELLAAGLD